MHQLPPKDRYNAQSDFLVIGRKTVPRVSRGPILNGEVLRKVLAELQGGDLQNLPQMSDQDKDQESLSGLRSGSLVEDNAVTPGPKALETILSRCGIRLEPQQIDLLWRYHREAPRGERRAQSDADPQLREHGAEALCGQPAGAPVHRVAVAADRHGLGSGIAGDPAEDRPARGPDDPGRAARRVRSFSARSANSSGSSESRSIPTKSGRIIPTKLLV